MREVAVDAAGEELQQTVEAANIAAEVGANCSVRSFVRSTDQAAVCEMRCDCSVTDGVCA